MTVGTDGLSAIATHHHTILNLVLVLLDHLEESINGDLLVDVLGIGRKPVPEPVFLLPREVHVGLENGEVVAGCPAAEFILPLFHLIAVPTLHTAFIDGKHGVGDDKFLVDADDASEPFTGGAGPQWRVEGEHIVAGLLKADAVGFETGGEVVGNIAGKEHQATLAVAFIESRLGGIEKTRNAVGCILYGHAADKQPDDVFAGIETLAVGFAQQGLVFKEVLDALECSFIIYTRITLLEFHFELLLKGTVFGNHQGSHHHEFGSALELARAGKDVLGGMLLDLLSADGGVGLSDAGEEKPQVLVDFGGSSDGGARIACDGLLLDGDGRGQTLDRVALRLAHTSQELASIGTERFHITTLTFGIKRVEGQRGFSAARDTRHDNELVAGNVERDTFKIVYARIAHFYIAAVQTIKNDL